jgi:hypothetical protein
MTKARYYEMCDALGSTPIEEEIPIEFEDFPVLVQTALTLYETLRDEWDYMAGNYIGKSHGNIFLLFDLYMIEEEERLLVYKIITLADNERRALIKARAKS